MDQEQTKEVKQRIMVGWLRRSLQGHVNSEILANLSDEDLIRHYQADTQRKIELLQARAGGTRIKIRL
jgi:hypothetical protein